MCQLEVIWCHSDVMKHSHYFIWFMSCNCCELWVVVIVTVCHCQLRARPERSQVRFCQNCGGKVRMVRPCRTSKVSKSVSNRLRTCFDLIFEDPNPKDVQNVPLDGIGNCAQVAMQKTWCEQKNTQFARAKLESCRHKLGFASANSAARHCMRSREAWISSISCFISSLVRNYFVIRPDARWSTLEFVYFGQFLRSEVWGA